MHEGAWSCGRSDAWSGQRDRARAFWQLLRGHQHESDGCRKAKRAAAAGLLTAICRGWHTATAGTHTLTFSLRYAMGMWRSCCRRLG